MNVAPLGALIKKLDNLEDEVQTAQLEVFYEKARLLDQELPMGSIRVHSNGSDLHITPRTGWILDGTGWNLRQYDVEYHTRPAELTIDGIMEGEFGGARIQIDGTSRENMNRMTPLDRHPYARHLIETLSYVVPLDYKGVTVARLIWDIVMGVDRYGLDATELNIWLDEQQTEEA